jgi:putative membrane protein
MKPADLLCVAVVAGIALGCSRTDRAMPEKSEPRAGGAAVGTSGAAANSAKNDDEFLRDVAIMNMADIELSRMALAKGTSPDLAAFAQRMIDDHGAAADKLKSAVSSSEIQWPGQLDDKHRKIVDDLATKEGADFRREYAERIVHGLQDLVAKLESRLDLHTLGDWKAAAAGRTQDKALPEPKAEMGDVKILPEQSDNAITMKINEWAAETYPAMQKHLDTARALESATKKRSTN